MDFSFTKGFMLMKTDEVMRECDMERYNILVALAYAARVFAGEEISAYA